MNVESNSFFLSCCFITLRTCTARVAQQALSYSTKTCTQGAWSHLEKNCRYYTRLLSIVLVKLTYCAPSTAQN